ncbi:MAG: hypothetical protein JWQ35_1303 [Bacteriovoracaceae bacterium]|nr:hypothetical protein [Bacteriovoracaceae bacterium]
MLSQAAEKIQTGTSTNIFIDANVFGTLLSGGQPDLELSKILTYAVLSQNNKLTLIGTEFSLLEYLGLPNLQHPPLPEFKKMPEGFNLYQIDAFLFRQALEFYQTCPELSLAVLKKRADDRRQHISNASKKFFDSFVTDFLTVTTVERLHVRLAMDFAHELNYPKEKWDEAWKNTVYDIQDHFEQGLPFPMFRRAARLSMNILKQRKHLKTKGTKYERDTTWKALDFKPFRDRLDGDVIWHGVMGLRKNKTTTPVHCFTSDPIERVKLKIVIMRVFAFKCHEMVAAVKTNEQTQKVFRGINPEYGYIHCLEPKTLRVLETIDVRGFLNLPAGNYEN